MAVTFVIDEDPETHEALLEGRGQGYGRRMMEAIGVEGRRRGARTMPGCTR